MMVKDTGIEWADSTSWGKPIIRRDGYLLVLCKGYPGRKSNKGHVLLHRLVVAASLKRALEPTEHVHHINGNKADNRIENLQLTTNSDHRKHHESLLSDEFKINRALKSIVPAAKKRRIQRVNVYCKCGCGASFQTPDKKGRFHEYIHGHNTRGKSGIVN